MFRRSYHSIFPFLLNCISFHNMEREILLPSTVKRNNMRLYTVFGINHCCIVTIESHCEKYIFVYPFGKIFQLNLAINTQFYFILQGSLYPPIRMNFLTPTLFWKLYGNFFLNF